MTDIRVTTNVGRDLLQSAQLFRSDRKVVWEYVSNSLQYTDPGVPPTVMVTIDEKRKVIRILDNGRGMSAEDLNQFFTMPGANPDRARGATRTSRGRGKLGLRTTQAGRPAARTRPGHRRRRPLERPAHPA